MPRFSLLVASLVCALSTPALAPPRFFFTGSGRLVLRHAHFKTTLDVRYRRSDGTYDAAALEEIAHFFRSREDGREAPISLRLIELLAYVQERSRPREMILVSGYRSPEFNADLRVKGGAAAQASLHTEAMAADMIVTGLDMRRVWLQLRELRTGGVGYYRTGGFLHIDTGPPRFWEETTSRVSENLAAGNARIFARTDFDRYPQLEGAVIGLHSVTAFPLLIRSQAVLSSANGESDVALEPMMAGAESGDGCVVIDAPAEAYRFRVVSSAAVTSAAGERARIVLSTCEPRVGRTPLRIETNPIEAGEEGGKRQSQKSKGKGKKSKGRGLGGMLWRPGDRVWSMCSVDPLRSFDLPSF